MASTDKGLKVPQDLRRTAARGWEQWLETGQFSVDLLVRTVGQDDLSGVELLDVGCGTKVVKTLLDNSMLIGHYAGVDVSPRVIEWLQENVSDPRFEFHHLDAHNEMYNPSGRPLADFDRLPVGRREFDLICLFSVFTHLAPHDFAAMLRLLRRHARLEGKLVFSLFLEDPEARTRMEAEIEQVLRARLTSDDPEVRERTVAAIEQALHPYDTEGDDRFVDEIPGQPLLVARYREGLVRELFEGSGWEIESLHPPERHIQHYLVCRPV